jgi:hypothetical protein
MVARQRRSAQSHHHRALRFVSEPVGTRCRRGVARIGLVLHPSMARLPAEPACFAALCRHLSGLAPRHRCGGASKCLVWLSPQQGEAPLPPQDDPEFSNHRKLSFSIVAADIGLPSSSSIVKFSSVVLLGLWPNR